MSQLNHYSVMFTAYAYCMLIEIVITLNLNFIAGSLRTLRPYIKHGVNRLSNPIHYDIICLIVLRNKISITVSEYYIPF